MYPSVYSASVSSRETRGQAPEKSSFTPGCRSILLTVSQMCPVWHFSVSLLALSYDSDCDSTVGSPRMSKQAIKLPVPLVGIF